MVEEWWKTYPIKMYIDPCVPGVRFFARGLVDRIGVFGEGWHLSWDGEGVDMEVYFRNEEAIQIFRDMVTENGIRLRLIPEITWKNTI